MERKEFLKLSSIAAAGFTLLPKRDLDTIAAFTLTRIMPHITSIRRYSSNRLPSF